MDERFVYKDAWEVDLMPNTKPFALEPPFTSEGYTTPARECHKQCQKLQKTQLQGAGDAGAGGSDASLLVRE